MQYDYTPKDIERFLGKIDKENSTMFYNGTRCWEWTAGRFSNGYGQISMGGRRGNKYLAHRISYELEFGKIDFGLLVLHHCDNRGCVNPSHLFLGTHKENAADMVTKGRQIKIIHKNQRHGSKHGMAKLDEEKVAEIRKRYGFRGKNGETTMALAKEFGVSFQTISDVIRKKLWKIE